MVERGILHMESILKEKVPATGREWMEIIDKGVRKATRQDGMESSKPTGTFRAKDPKIIYNLCMSEPYNVPGGDLQRDVTIASEFVSRRLCGSLMKLELRIDMNVWAGIPMYRFCGPHDCSQLTVAYYLGFGEDMQHINPVGLSKVESC